MTTYPFPPALLRHLVAVLLAACPIAAAAQSTTTDPTADPTSDANYAAQATKPDFFGTAAVPLNPKTHSPGLGNPDPYGSDLYVDGRTDVAMDANSMAAATLAAHDEKGKNGTLNGDPNNSTGGYAVPGDRSVRLDTVSGQPQQILITVEHKVQITLERDGKIIYARRVYPGEANLVNVTFDPTGVSPYLYIEAKEWLPGQSTNLFIETQEDNRIQTYVINLIIAKPKDIREQVLLNLVTDNTPELRTSNDGQTSNPNKPPPNPDDEDVMNPTATNPMATAGGTPGYAGESPITAEGGTFGGGLFTREDVYKYFETMIEMAEHYKAAKAIEAQTGQKIYKPTDIVPGPQNLDSFVDPNDVLKYIAEAKNQGASTDKAREYARDHATQYGIRQVWYYPRYDAILLDVIVFNPGPDASTWDYSQIKWIVDRARTAIPSTAVSPARTTTDPADGNQLWVLIQGQHIEPNATFTPAFPRHQ